MPRIARFFVMICIIALSALLSAMGAIAQIAPITTDSRIRTLVYNPNEVYELKFFYGYQSFIEFSEDEEVEMISVGEAFAWRFTPAGRRLFIRPLEIAAHTNMTIITNRRTYNFDIRSGEYDGKADQELVYIVRFYYPKVSEPIPLLPPALATVTMPPPPPPAQAMEQKMPDAWITKKLPGTFERNPEGLPMNFNYSITGKEDSGISPIKVYDNTRATYLKFKNDNLLIPSIASVDQFGAENPLSYRLEDGYVVIEGVMGQITLRSGNALLCIFNNNALGR